MLGNSCSSSMTCAKPASMAKSTKKYGSPLGTARRTSRPFSSTSFLFWAHSRSHSMMAFCMDRRKNMYQSGCISASLCVTLKCVGFKYEVNKSKVNRVQTWSNFLFPSTSKTVFLLLVLYLHLPSFIILNSTGCKTGAKYRKVEL